MTSTTDFARYLDAKRTVDERALNAHVRGALDGSIAARAPQRILDLGAGVGATIERLGPTAPAARFTAVERDPALARELGRRHASARDLEIFAGPLHDFTASARGEAWDLVTAHAVLDLLPLQPTLSAVLPLLRPGGLLYLTLNFDGSTLFLPALDGTLDERITEAYHATMDARRERGEATGGRYSGRRLLQLLPQLGVELLTAGSSDWVVVPRRGAYPDDEAFFLEFILRTVEGALAGGGSIEDAELRGWLRRRRDQLEHGELIFIARQLDILARNPETP